ncbi:MAG: hypothetical protein KAR40_16665 [Candidatus Sabulitectum sp.]|nr:hypothetical protein [Candidatus Sabulitectum sp.]
MTTQQPEMPKKISVVKRLALADAACRVLRANGSQMYYSNILKEIADTGQADLDTSPSDLYNAMYLEMQKKKRPRLHFLGDGQWTLTSFIKKG